MGFLDKALGGAFIGTSSAEKITKGLNKSRPKKLKETPQEIALSKQMRADLNEKKAKKERYLKLGARGKLGRSSLEEGANRTPGEAAGVRTGGVGSMLPGTGSSGASGSPSRSPRGMRGFGSRR